MASNFFMQMSSVSKKYQDVSVKAVEQVEFPVHALPMQHSRIITKGNNSNRIGPLPLIFYYKRTSSRYQCVCKIWGGGGIKMWVGYFSMRNPYMKFQNPSMHGSWWTYRWTHARTDNPKPICALNFFQVGGITKAACSVLTLSIGTDRSRQTV